MQPVNTNSEVPAQLGRLDKAIAELNDLLVNLNDRLVSVTKQLVPEPIVATGEVTAQELVPLAASIRSMAIRVENCSKDVSLTIDGIEL